MLDRPIKILLVEDNPADVRLVVEALKEVGINGQLHTAEDGDDAVAFLRRRGRHAAATRPDVIMLDLNLPGTDGRSVLREIKADADLKAIPVLVISSSSAEGDVAAAYDEQANCFIAKPVDFDGFRQVMHAIDDFWFATVRLPPIPSVPATGVDRVTA